MTEAADGLAVASLARSEFEAHAQAAILHEEGIDAFVHAPVQWQGAALASNREGVPVYVRKEHAQQAAELLRERRTEHDAQDAGDREAHSSDGFIAHEPLSARSTAAGVPILARVGIVIGFALVVLTLLAWIVGALIQD